MKSHSDRYSRQVLFQPIGEAGQRRLINSRVVIIGCGALGSAQAESLARAGVAVGADGLMIEVHCKPEEALSDGAQALTLDEFEEMAKEVNAIHEVIAEPRSGLALARVSC